MNRSLLRTGVLAPLAALAVIAAAPAQARTDDGGRAAKPASAAMSAAPAASGAAVEAIPAGRARDVAGECTAAGPESAGRLTGPVPGALFEGAPGLRGAIPERSLS